MRNQLTANTYMYRFCFKLLLPIRCLDIAQA